MPRYSSHLLISLLNSRRPRRGSCGLGETDGPGRGVEGPGSDALRGLVRTELWAPSALLSTGSYILSGSGGRGQRSQGSPWPCLFGPAVDVVQSAWPGPADPSSRPCAHSFPDTGGGGSSASPVGLPLPHAKASPPYVPLPGPDCPELPGAPGPSRTWEAHLGCVLGHIMTQRNSRDAEAPASSIRGGSRGTPHVCMHTGTHPCSPD